MSTQEPLLVAQLGNEGTFLHWLDKLGVKEFLKGYSLSQLIEWGWGVPHYRILFSSEFFTAWKNFPYTDRDIEPRFDLQSLLWDSSWWIDGMNEPLWFLHPFLRPADKAGCLLAQQGKAAIKAPVPAPFTHPNGRTIKPYADYFFHWQGYALIDVIRSADRIQPLLLTPNIEARAATMVRLVSQIKNHDPRDVLTIARCWGGLAKPMTWLSHYRAFRAALESYKRKHPEDRSIHCRGAEQLADHLDVNAETLSSALKDQMLVLAQDWRWANDRGCVWTARAWPQLQRDIAIAVEWLCYLSGKTLDHFLDEWQYAHRGQEQWAQLHTILPYEFFTDRKYFLEIAPHYLATYNSLLPEAERLEGANLKGTVDRIRSMNYPFDSFLSAFRQLHEELSYGHDRNGALDFRELRPLDYYSLLALRAEGSMRYALESSGQLAQIAPEKHGLTTYITYLAGQRGLGFDAIKCFQQEQRRHTDLKAIPAHPIDAIRILAPKIGALEDCLIRAFLCCVLARNYFAHHYYLDRELLHSDQSAFMLSGILVTVLHLL